MFNRINFSLFQGNTPVLLQAESGECGLTCLAMIMYRHGYQRPIQALRADYGGGNSGETLESLSDFASKHNMTCRGLKMELQDLHKLTLPAILHWGFDHFVVLSSVNSTKVTIHDPAVGKRSISLNILSKYFTGIAMEVAPGTGFKKQKETEELDLKHIWPAFTSMKKPFYIGLTLSVFIQLFALTFPLYYHTVIDRVISRNDIDLLYAVVAFFIGLAIFNLISSIYRAREELFISTNFSFFATTNILNHLFHLPIGFFESRKPGSIISRINATRHIERALSGQLINTLIDGILSISIMAILFWYNAKLSSVVILFIGIYIFMSWVYYKQSSALEIESSVNQSEEQTNLIEAIQSIQTTKLYVKEHELLDQWKRRYTDTLNGNIKSNNIKIIFRNMSDFLFHINRIIMIAVAATMALESTFTVGQFFAFFLYSSLLVTRVKAVAATMVSLKTMSIHYDRISDILLEKREAFPETNKPPLQKEIEGNITLRDLTYRYPKSGETLLKQVNIDIKSGEFVAFIGPSGSGKTTLIKLLLGLYQPNKGKVLYEGKPLQRYDLKQLRSQISTVMQDDVLIAGSVLKNIALFETKPNLQKAIQASRLARIHSDIEKLPLKYNTQVRQSSNILSGGQKQRLLLARALYRSPKVLLMDEGTSSLDEKNEVELNKNLKSLNITRVIVAHRRESIRAADRVFEVQDKCLRELYSKPEETNQSLIIPKANTNDIDK